MADNQYDNQVTVLTSAQLAAPTAEMLASNGKFRLASSIEVLYESNGAALVPPGGGVQTSLIAGAASVLPPSGALGVVAFKQALTLCEFGASFNELNDRFGLGFSPGVNIAGAVTIYGNILAPSGNCLLEYNAGTRQMRCTLNGEVTGPWVGVRDGIFILPSGNSSNYLRVSVIARLMPATDKSDTLTSGTRVWSRPNGSWKYQLSFATKERIKWLPTQGIGGSQSTDIAGRMDQIAALPADAYLMCYSGNDSVTGGLSVSTSVAQTMANADYVLKTGRALIPQTLPARWGRGPAGESLTFTAEYTAQRQANLVNGNRGVISASSTRRLNIADWSNATNALDANSSAYNGYTVDGKHPAGGLAHVAADANLPIINAMLVENRVTANVGGGDYYNASLNPGGNLMQSNQGAFAGAGGALNAGSSPTASWSAAAVVPNRAFRINAGNLYYAAVGGTTGTVAPTHLEGSNSDGAVSWAFIQSGVVAGLGDNWSCTVEGAGVTVNAHSYTERDGTRWQEFIVFGATIDGNAFRIAPQPTVLPNIGDVVVMDYDVEIPMNPRDCYGLICTMELTGGNAIIWDNQSMSGIQQGLKWASGKMAVEPMPIFPGITNIQPRLKVQSKINGLFRVRYKSVSVRKILP